jgi:membrane associated rhomboid family serine protease
MATCYRHPSRETGVACSNCGRPICPDCMTATPVGMRCPECARQRTRVQTMRTFAVNPTVTYVLIAINALVYVGTTAGGTTLAGGGHGGSAFHDLALWGPGVADGDVWRLVTGGFLHWSVFHLAVNMYALYVLGRMLEPALGHVRFGALYGASLLAGSFGALLLTPNSLTAGASGAIFGLLGAAIVMARNRGIDLMASGLGPVLLINLAITFFPGFNISIGGHIGGLIGGALAALAIEGAGRRRLPAAVPVAACVLLAAISVAASLATV